MRAARLLVSAGGVLAVTIAATGNARTDPAPPLPARPLEPGLEIAPAPDPAAPRDAYELDGQGNPVPKSLPAEPRARVLQRFPMVVIQHDVSRYPMPVVAHDGRRYTIRLVPPRP